MTLETATQARNHARVVMNACKLGSKAWRLAEEDLNFWQGKVANLEAQRRVLGC